MMSTRPSAKFTVFEVHLHRILVSELGDTPAVNIVNAVHSVRLYLDVESDRLMFITNYRRSR